MSKICNINTNVCRFAIIFIVALLSSFFMMTAFAAGISIDRTRVVFNSNDKNHSVGVINTSSVPWLVQARILDQNGQRQGALFITPPLFRLEPSGKNVIRIVSTGAEGIFPSDREDIRYLHIDAVPSSSPSEKDSQLAVGVGMTIKVFMRPVSLDEPGKKNWESIRWYYTSGLGVKGCNTSPYYLSFNRLAFDERSIDLNANPSMLPPYQCIVFGEKLSVKKIHWSFINDFGGDSGLFSAILSKGDNYENK